MTWTRAEIAVAWRRGREIEGLDPTEWRLDHLGRTMCFQDYGRFDSRYGWDIVTSRVPQSSGRFVSQLRPVNCRSK